MTVSPWRRDRISSVLQVEREGTRTPFTAWSDKGGGLWETAGADPSLDLWFAASKSLKDQVSGNNLITFTRACEATYVVRMAYSVCTGVTSPIHP